MFRSIWMLSIHAHDFFQHYMPSNRLLAATRTRRGLKWGVPAMLVSVPYLAIAALQSCGGRSSPPATRSMRSR